MELRMGEEGANLHNEASRPTQVAPWQLTGLCLAQRRTSVPSRARTGWTAATPRSPLSSAGAGAAASTPASPTCPGASSRCRSQVSWPHGHQALCGPAMAPPGAPGPWAMAVRWWRPQSEASCPGQSAASGCPRLSCCQAVCAKCKSNRFQNVFKVKVLCRKNQFKNYPGEKWKIRRCGELGQLSRRYSANQPP